MIPTFTNLNDKYWITFWELKILGFDYPPIGTEVIIKPNLLGDFEYNYKYNGPIYEGIYVSPYLSKVGRRHLPTSEVYVEFSPKLFKYLL